MKKLFTILLLLGLIFSPNISFSEDEVLSELDEKGKIVLNEELRTIQKTADDMQDDLTDAETDIETNQTDIDATESDITGLEALSVKGWVNFNGTGTIAIRDSYNVSGISDRGTGLYTVTWDTDFANTDYFVSVEAHYQPAVLELRGGLESMSVGSVDVNTATIGGALTDSAIVCVIAFGEQ